MNEFFRDDQSTPTKLPTNVFFTSPMRVSQNSKALTFKSYLMKYLGISFEISNDFQGRCLMSTKTSFPSRDRIDSNHR